MLCSLVAPSFFADSVSSGIAMLDGIAAGKKNDIFCPGNPMPFSKQKSPFRPVSQVYLIF